MKNNAKNLDMTNGNPMRLLLVFAVPIFFGSIFQFMYNTVDSIIVGRFISSDALGAVGSCGSSYGMLFSLNMGAANGLGILIAQCFGARREQDIRPYIVNGAFLLTISSVTLMIAGYFLAAPLLRLLDTPEALMKDATTYLSTVCLGLLGSAIYNLIAAVMRALGDSRTPLYFLIFSSVLNMLLDILFVTVLKMGVMGVAAATVISQYTVAVITIIFAVKKYTYFRIGKEDLRFNRRFSYNIIKVGLPLALQGSAINLSIVILQRFINAFGTTIIAANTVAGKYDNFMNMPISALSVALATFVGQNIGAKKMERITKAVRVMWIFTIFYSVLIFVLAFTVGSQFVSLFTDDPEVISYGFRAVKLYSIFTVLLCNIYNNRGVINGSGDTRFSLIGGLIEVLFRVGFAYLFLNVLKVGFDGIYFAVASNWLVTGMFFLFRYVSGKWKLKSLI